MARHLTEFVVKQREIVFLLLFVSIILGLGKSIPHEQLKTAFDYYASTHYVTPYSIFSMVSNYWFYGVLTLEALVLLLPSLHSTSFSIQGHANPFNPCLVAMVLLITFLASWLRWTHIRHFAPAPDELLYSPLCSALVVTAGAALLIQLGHLLNLRLPKMGFWIVMFLDLMPNNLKEIYPWFSSLQIGTENYQVAKLIFFAAIIYGSAVVLIKIQEQTKSKDYQKLFFLSIFVQTASFLIYYGWTHLAQADTSGSSIIVGLRQNSIVIAFLSFTYLRWVFLAMLFGWLIFLSDEPFGRKLVLLFFFLVWFSALYGLQHEKADFNLFKSYDPLLLAWMVMHVKEAWRVQRKTNPI